jgi:hypothetical protein
MHYIPYRFAGSNIQANLKQALNAYWGKYRQTPKSIAVNPKQLQAALELVAEIELPAEVKEFGGVFVTEVWLEG